MIHTLQAVLAPALMERLVLIINHVLGAEPAATRRLAVHDGRVIELQLRDWPSLLPPPPVLAFRVTPAGMLEWCGPQTAGDVDLRVVLNASNPLALAARAVAGETPEVDIDGDALLAGDVNWLLGNLRWDVAGDLERVFGPAVALPLQRLGSALARGLRAATRAAAGARAPTP